MGNALSKPDPEIRETSMFDPTVDRDGLDTASTGDSTATTPGTFDEDPAAFAKNRIRLEPAMEARGTVPSNEASSSPPPRHRAPVPPANSPETDLKRYGSSSSSSSYTDKYAGMNSDSDFFQFIVGPAVNIFVGPEEIQFTLPQKLLYYHSRFAERAIEGFFIEASEKALRLPQDDPEVFYWLVQWMLQGKLVILDQFKQNYQWKYGRQDWREYACRLLCRLWILGDKILKDPEECRRWPGMSLAWDIRWGLYHLFSGAQDDEMQTPVTPEIVIEVWGQTVPDIEEPDKPMFPVPNQSLRQILFSELCGSHFHKPGVLDCSEYSKCFTLDRGKFGADAVAYLMSHTNITY